MTLANTGLDLQTVTGGLFVLGSVADQAPHRAAVLDAVVATGRAGCASSCSGSALSGTAWQHGTPLDFPGEFYTHTRMIPAFDPDQTRSGLPPILTRRVRTAHDRGGW